MSSSSPTSSVVDRVLALLADGEGRPYIGEPVSQLAHALQCAYLAVLAGAGDALVAAALLHDVGHSVDPDAATMGDHGTAFHERVGAEYLRGLGFPEAVAELVRGHVDAKRYLVTRTPGYLEKLSAASVFTLRCQGGAMSEADADAFAARAGFREVLRLRAWDEQAKRVGWVVPGLDSYRGVLAALAT